MWGEGGMGQSLGGREGEQEGKEGWGKVGVEEKVSERGKRNLRKGERRRMEQRKDRRENERSRLDGRDGERERKDGTTEGWKRM